MRNAKTAVGCADEGGDNMNRVSLTIEFDITNKRDLRTVAGLMALAKKVGTGVTIDELGDFLVGWEG